MNPAFLLFQILFYFGCIKGEEDRQFIVHPNPISEIDFKAYGLNSGLMSCVSDDEQFVYVTNSNDGVSIVDLSNIIIPKLVSTVKSPFAQHCEVKNDYLFIADQQVGLVIYDVHDKSNPKLMSTTAYVEMGIKPSYQYVLLSPDMKVAFTLSFGFVLSYSLLDLSHPQLFQVVAQKEMFAPNSYRLRFDPTYSFIAVANHISGVSIIDIRSIQNQKLRALSNPDFVIWDSIFTPDKLSLYAIDCYSGLYYADPSQLYTIPQDSNDFITLHYQNIQIIQYSVFSAISITADGTHLIIGFRSTGISIYKLNKLDYKKLTYIQHLQGQYIILSVNLSKNNEKYMYVTNGLSLTIFQSVQPNTNQDFPNLFNTFQSSLTYQSEGFNRFGITCLENHVLVSNANDNVNIYETNDHFQPKFVSQINRIKDPNHPTDLTKNFDLFSTIEVSSDEKTVYIAASKSGLISFNIDNKSNPIEANTYNFIVDSVSYTQVTSVKLSKNNDRVIAGNSFYGALRFMTMPDNLSTLMMTNVYQNNLACGIERCDFTKDGSFFACACREIGVILFESALPGQEQNWFYVFTQLGAEEVMISSDDKFIFVANGFQGLYIIDVSDFKKPQLLSQLVLLGWAQSVYPLFDDRYLIVSEVEKGQLSLINIEDKKNPYVQQRVQFTGESATKACLIKNKPQHLYFIGGMGLRYLPSMTDLKIHSQFQVEVLGADNKLLYYETLGEKDNLLVGQKIRVTFVPLYTEQNLKISSVKYYRYFEKQILPSWITFLPSKGQIFISVSKLGATNDFSTEKKGENILILEVFIQIQQGAFQDKQGIIVSSDLSKHLYILLQQNGYLDYNGYLTTKFDPQVPFDLQFYNTVFTKADYESRYDQIQYIVKKVLTFSKVDYPIRFFIVTSLKFNFSKNQRNLQNVNSSFPVFISQKLDEKERVISTPSQQVSIFMQITQNGKFVKKIFEGVLASFSDDLTNLKISGQTSFVNDIVEKSIQIYNTTSDLSQVKITFILSDSNNDDITLHTTLQDIGFAQIHKPVYLNKEKSLQSQFNSYYSNGDVYIEERFQFSFDQYTFIQQDNLKISYKVYTVDGDNKMNEIQIGSWIEFSAANLGFSGMKSSSSFLDTERIRVVASDGYSEAYDEFSMTFNKIPFFYALQLIISFLGPILGILGLWKYRYEIHLFVAERKNMYKSEVAVVGKMFKKQIILYGSVQQDVLAIWKLLLKENKGLQKQLEDEYKQNHGIDIQNLVNQLEKIYQKQHSQFPLIDPREFDFDDSRLVRSVKRLAYQLILNKDSNTQKAYSILQQQAIKNFGKKDWYKYYLAIYPNMQVINNLAVNSGKLSNEIYQKQERQTNPYQQLQSREQQQFQQDKPQFVKIGNFSEYQQNHQLRFRDEAISLFKIDSKQMINENQEQKLESNSQTFNNQILSERGIQIPADQQSQGTERDNLKINRNLLYSDNPQVDDKIYQKKKNSHQIQFYANLNPFPEILVKQQMIEETLNMVNFKQFYDFNLLGEILILDASGVILNKPSSVNPSVGESIHVFPSDLFTLQAFTKGKETNFVSRVLDFLNMNYSTIGLVNNNPLPKWLNYSISDGIINIWGTPQPSDDADILIRIINKSGFTVYSFHICIQDNQGNDLRDKKIMRQVTQRFPATPKRNQTIKILSSQNIISQTQNNLNNVSIKNQNNKLKEQSELINSIRQNSVEDSLKSPPINTGFQTKPQIQDFELQKIDEERPQSIQEYQSDIENNLKNKLSFLKESSIIIDTVQDGQNNNNNNNKVKQQVFKSKPE